VADHDVTSPEQTQTAIDQRRGRGKEQALLSALVPGLGQLAQGRLLSAGIQFGTVVTYLVGALAAGGGRALFLAALWNVWSVIDAYRHERD
jgi:hypothetical protein